jgi:NADP-dependent 3-hydroxy acid dehydrogenase YdfG
LRRFDGKRYWLVGASEGLGKALAQKMSAAGAELYLSARNREALEELAVSLPGKAHAMPVDVSDRESVRAAAAQVGEIDGVVYLAGVYWPTPAQKWNADEVEMMCDINFTGGARVVGAVIGQMVARNSGHVVLTGSLSGFRGLPGAIGYSASKAGLMALAESMYADLRNTGVQVQVANPGFIRTRLTDKNDFTMPFIMEPEEAARIMFEHMTTDRFKISFPFLFSLLFRFSQFWPDWLYYRVFKGKA